MRTAQSLFGSVALDPFGAQVDQHQVRVGAVGHGVQTTFVQLIGQGLGVLDHLLLIELEGWVECLAECHSFGRDNVHQRTTLNARKDGRVELFRQRLVIGQDHAATGATQGLVGRGGGRMHMGHRVGVEASGNQTGKMGHVRQHVSADLVGNLADAGKVDLTGNGRAARNDHLRFVLQRQRFHLVIVDVQSVTAHAVLDGIEPLARLVRFGPVCQVATGVQRHAKDRIAWLQKRLEHTLVGLRPRIGLHVGKAAVKKLLGPFNCKRLRHVHILAAAIVPTARIPFGIFVGHDRPLGFEHRLGHDVLGGDQLDFVALAAQLVADRLEQFGVTIGEALSEKTICAVRCIHWARPF
mmetsp:Transcript_7200/g.11906  ORF Transcript_7200/g.11906 Transcript_7200/m.11906 type:complete len:353 (+) Transcript_7200:1236-2294(+)